MENYVIKGSIIKGRPVVDLPMAKANSNIEHGDGDDLLELMLEAAIDEAQNYTGLILRKQNITIGFSCMANFMALPIGPIVSIAAVEYAGADGEPATVDPSKYKLLPSGNGLGHALKFSPDFTLDLEPGNPYPLTVKAVAGFDKVPADIVQAILLIFSESELFREDRAAKLNKSSRAKLRPYRQQ